MPIQILMEATLTVVQCTVNAYYMEAQQHVSDPYAMQYKTLSHGMSITISTTDFTRDVPNTSFQFGSR